MTLVQKELLDHIVEGVDFTVYPQLEGYTHEPGCRSLRRITLLIEGDGGDDCRLNCSVEQNKKFLWKIEKWKFIHRRDENHTHLNGSHLCRTQCFNGNHTWEISSMHVHLDC